MSKIQFKAGQFVSYDGRTAIILRGHGPRAYVVVAPNRALMAVPHEEIKQTYAVSAAESRMLKAAYEMLKGR